MPSKPTPPTRGYSFSDFQESLPTAPLPAPNLDIELDRAFQAIQEMIAWAETAIGDDGGFKAIPPDGIGGPEGPQGPAGDPGLNHRGDWDPATAYAKNDGVYFEGSTWIARVANTGVAPPAFPVTVSNEWQLLALGNAGAGVSSFNGRSGAVLPDPADYQNLYIPVSGGQFQGEVILYPGSSVAAIVDDPAFGGSFLLEGAGVNRDVVMENYAGTFRVYDPLDINGFNLTLTSAALSFKGQAVWHAGNLSLSPYALTLLDDTTATEARATLGLGAAATLGKSTQAQAEAGTDDTTAMTPLRVKQAIDKFTAADQGPGIFNRVQIFTASGSWTVPAGVTSVFSLCIGGGGGGGEGATQTSPIADRIGGSGGYGGLAIGVTTVVPGASETVTVGAGGSGSNSGNGGAGGSSSFNGVTATGGGGGQAATTSANGSSGSNGSRSGSADTNMPIANISEFLSGDFLSFITTLVGTQVQARQMMQYFATRTNTRGRASSSTAATAYSTSVSSNLLPGARGSGEDGGGGSNATGGVGGCVLLMWLE